MLEEFPASVDTEGLESTDVWSNQKERVLEVSCGLTLIEGEFQERRLRTFDVSACSISILAIQANPQRRAGDEHLPPTTTNMSHLDQVFILTVFQVLRDEEKDVWRNLVDRCELVLHRSNQAKHFQCVPLENIDLQ